jgi:hypothetical protein
MVKEATKRLIKRFNHATFVHRYGTLALFWAGATNCRPLIRMFLETGVNPFAQGLDFPDADLWRMDRWYYFERYASHLKQYGLKEYALKGNLPTEFVLQAWCSSPFQAACAFKNDDITKTSIAWNPALRAHDSENFIGEWSRSQRAWR